MRSAPFHRAAVRQAIVEGSVLVIAVTVLCGCGGATTRRLAAQPAVRLDRPAPAAPATPPKPPGFEEDTVREERLADAGATPEESGGGNSTPEQPDRNDPSRSSRKREKKEAPPAPSSEPGTARGRRDAEAREPQDAPENGAAVAEDAPPLKHVLRRGQTLYSVAKMYGVEVPALMKANGITNARHVSANTLLVVPVTRPARGGSAAQRSPAVTQASLAPGPGLPEAGETPSGPKKKKAPGGDEPRAADQPALAWPVHGAVTAAFGRRGKSDHHEGIDIDGQTGDPIHAAASGVVAFAGTHGDYGRTIVIDHGEGWRTVYAHASILNVEEGDPVRVGDPIAEVGHSGNARGSHLHFEVRRDGRAMNPLPYLRATDTLTAGVVPTPKAKSKPREAKGKSTQRP